MEGANFRAFGRLLYRFYRNTPLIVQLFFFAFGLPGLIGYVWPFWCHALLALTINFSGYFAEILRSGYASTASGQLEAAISLNLSRPVTFFKVILPQTIIKMFPSLSSQFIFIFLTTGVISEIGVSDLTHAGIFIDSRTFRFFRGIYHAFCNLHYFGTYSKSIRRNNFQKNAWKSEVNGWLDFIVWEPEGIIISQLIWATQYTIYLSVIAFLGGGLFGSLITLFRILPIRLLNTTGYIYIWLFQSLPLLMLLFLLGLGIPKLFGQDIDPWIAASVALILFTSAYLAEVWRGA